VLHDSSTFTQELRMPRQESDVVMHPSHTSRAASFLALAGILTLACIGVIDPVPSTTGELVVVHLDGLSPNCSVIGGNARSVRVVDGPSGVPVSISFSLSCVGDGAATKWED
jgi:hypothetical protein